MAYIAAAPFAIAGGLLCLVAFVKSPRETWEHYGKVLIPFLLSGGSLLVVAGVIVKVLS